MVAVLGMCDPGFDGPGRDSSLVRCRPSWNASPHGSTDWSCSPPPCTVTSAASSWRPTARRRGAAHGIPSAFVQDNHSRSRRGTLRGIHFQTHPGQGKLVRVARGRVLDVAVDLRRGSPTFGEWESFELDDVRGRQLWIPVGFGHGFCVLSDEADFVYKCTAYYDAATESGISLRRSRRRDRVAARGRARSTASATAMRRGWPRSPTRCRSDTAREHATAASRPARPARCTSATCAPRCWRGCSPARRARASSCGWRTSTRGACGSGSASEQLEDLRAIGLDWDGEVRVAVGAQRGLRGGDRAAAGRRARSTSASARGRRSARRRRRRTGRCPRAPTPAPACG